MSEENTILDEQHATPPSADGSAWLRTRADRILGDETQEHGTDEQLAALYGAMARAKANFKPVPKSREGQVGHQKFKYAPMSVLQDCTTLALSAEGIAVIQPFSMVDGKGCLRTIVSHKDGARLVSCFRFLPEGKLGDLGKQSTYYRRYAYQSVLCVDSGDMDPDEDGSQGLPSGAGRTQPQQNNPAPQAQSKKVNRGPRTASVSVVRPEDRTPEQREASKPKGEPKPEQTKPKEEPKAESAPPKEEPEGPGMSKDYSKKLNEFFIAHKFKGPEVLKLCADVTGRRPEDLDNPGGQALAEKLMAAAVKAAESRS